MLKKGLFVIMGLLALSQPALAVDPQEALDPSLPELPRASDLSSSNIGQHFILKNERGSEQVFFVGYSYEGTPIAYSTTDAPPIRHTFQDAATYCASKGPGWKLPTMNEIRILSPHAGAADPGFLPGSYWTTTLAPCVECGQPELYKMAYDIGSGNVRNGYAMYFTKFYTACTYPIP